VPRTYKISVLPGDGIGRDVVPEAVRVLDEVQKQVGGFQTELHEFEMQYFLAQSEQMMKEEKASDYQMAILRVTVL